VDEEATGILGHQRQAEPAGRAQSVNQAGLGVAGEASCDQGVDGGEVGGRFWADLRHGQFP
jgi:hypothetical protein